MTLRTRLLATLVASIAAVGIPLVLYEIRVRDVHESTAPPPVLDKLKLTQGAPAAPDVGFSDSDGKALKLNDFRGRYVVINLWATWCGPCINELPSLVKLQAALPQDKITVVPIDLERIGVERVSEFLKMHAIEGLPIYVDRDYSTLRGFAANELPLTIVIDSEGREVARAAGAQHWDSAESVAYLKAISTPKPPA
jgi:thiol-disulfide isomerase/thioredoxin